MYEIKGHEFPGDHPRLQEVLAMIYPRKIRPLCLCKRPGIPMYVAQHGEKFVIKRMPGTGQEHDPKCESFEIPPELSGLGHVNESAILEDPESGKTTLKFNFRLSKGASRKPPTPGESDTATIKTDGSKLTIIGLLHYLWEQAGFNTWAPMMEGKRNWAVVRKYLLQAANDKEAKGNKLGELLYIPEMFNLEQKDELTRKRTAAFSRAMASGQTKNYLILVGELKEIQQTRTGLKMIIKHVPDIGFMMDEALSKQYAKRFETENQLAAGLQGAHQIVIGTFSVNQAGIPVLEELAQMNVNENWIPFENLFEHQAIAQLIAGKRRFTKSLRYNLGRGTPLASVIMKDREPIRVLYIDPPGASEDYRKKLSDLVDAGDYAGVIWETEEAAFPKEQL